MLINFDRKEGVVSLVDATFSGVCLVSHTRQKDRAVPSSATWIGHTSCTGGFICHQIYVWIRRGWMIEVKRFVSVTRE